MRAMQLRDRGDVTVDRLTEVDLEPPALEADEVLVEVDACAMCRTDLQIAEGDIPPHKSPVTPGHQIVGTIVKRGAAVAPTRLGTRVGITWLANACLACKFCASGRENLCIDAQFTGWDVDGGYATQVVAKSEFTYDLAPFADRSSVSIAPLMCAGVIGYRALRVAELGPHSAGKKLGLYGYGASARQVLQMAQHWGIDIHVAARTDQDCIAAIADGAQSAALYDAAPPAPLDAAITFAPVGSVVDQALGALDRGGIVSINAIHLDQLPTLDYDRLWWERSIRSVANVTRADATEFIQLAAAINLQAAYEPLTLDEANRGLRRMASGDVVGSFVLTE